MLVSENTQKSLIEIIGKCFEGNRIFDRAVSVLGTKFAYNNTAKLLHKGVAHLFPLIADEIGEKTLERYNIPIFYPFTPEGGKKYSSVADIIKDLKKYVIDFQINLMGVCEIAQNNNDIHVYVDMLDILEDFNKVVEQMILLSDKIDIYGTNPSFDQHIKTGFWILGEEN